jgi:hemoglobin
MDIQSRADIEKLMTQFYDKVKKDPVIGYIFNDIARIDWDHHIPLICDFWETLLLDSGSYTRNAMQVHYVLNRKVRLEEKHFERWLQLFFETLDELFAGEKAMLAKKRARSIASLMQFKMQQENNGINPGNTINKS